MFLSTMAVFREVVIKGKSSHGQICYRYADIKLKYIALYLHIFNVISHNHICFVKGPAADATDAPQS